MPTLIYKRTHIGDPDPATGVFGERDCMGPVRDWPFDKVIGVGGIGHAAQSAGIAGKITWIGIGPHRRAAPADFHGRSIVAFDHYRDYGKDGPLLRTLAPKLAARLYGRNVRVVMGGLSAEERGEVKSILKLAYDAPPSPGLAREKSGASPPRHFVEWCCPRRREASRAAVPS